jgi:4-oxalocrotonate tautomerase family enzyme
MPLVRIDIQKGRSREFLISLLNVTIDTVQQILKLPKDDKNIRLNEFDPDFFLMKPPYALIIEISMFSGRSNDTKRALYQSIVVNLKEKLDIDLEDVFILINEQPKENWGIRGGIPASEVDLGFRLDI